MEGIYAAKAIASLGIAAAVGATVWITKDGAYLWWLLALLIVW